MLAISEAQVQALGHSTAMSMLPRIDAWLAGELSPWQAADQAQRREHLRQMLGMAQASGMRAERDYAVFAWICASLGSDWYARLSSQEVSAMLRDPQWDPEPKLLRLDEMFGLTGAPQ